jgi:hypothetical protein
MARIPGGVVSPLVVAAKGNAEWTGRWQWEKVSLRIYQRPPGVHPDIPSGQGGRSMDGLSEQITQRWRR